MTPRYATMTREELVEAWRSATTERERARLESTIFRTVPREDRRKTRTNGSIASVVGPILNHSEYLITLRLRLLRAGVEAIWERIDGPEQMPMRTAVRLLNQARVRGHAQNLMFDEAFRQELDEYDNLEVCSRVQGRPFRKKPMGPRKTARATWGSVRAAVRALVERELRGVNERARERLEKQMDVEIDTLFEALTARVHRAKKAGDTQDVLPQAVRTDRNHLRAACQTLGIDPPKPGKEANGSAAKKNFRRLVHECHPDVAGDAGRPQYEAVVAAYRYIEQYNSGIAAISEGDTP
jgi:hypothetical protein